MRILVCLLSVAILSAQTLVPVNVNQAILRGQKYKSRKQFLEDGMKRKKIQLAGAFALDGISKYVTFFTDNDAIAAAAAQAKQELKSFGVADLESLPLSGLLYAHVEVHGRGDLPTRKVQTRYVENPAHLVLMIDEDVLQPLTKSDASARDASLILPASLYAWWSIGGVSLLTGGDLGLSGAKAEMEFAFRLPEQLPKEAVVVLVDGDGNRHQSKVSFARILE